MRPRRLRSLPRLLPLAALVLGCGGESPVGTQKEPVEIHAAAPEQLVGAVGTPVPESLAVRVQTVAGVAVPGVDVAWVASGGGTLSASSTRTDAAGVARTMWTLGPTAGSQTATASVAGAASVTFTASAAVPARLEKVSGDVQTSAAGTNVSEPLVVRVVDAAGVAVRGAAVTWEVTTGGGVTTSPTSVTDAQGLATVRWQLGALTIAQWVRASVGSAASVTFGATATGVLAATITALPTQLWLKPAATREVKVQVKDAAGQAFADQTVSWSTSSSAIATVSSLGVVTGVAEGTATITAARDGKRAEISVTVDGTPPTLTRFTFTPTAVDVSGGPVKVAFIIGAADAGSGIDAGMVNVVSPSGGQLMWCSQTSTLSAGTPAAGEFACEGTMRAAAEAGTWKASVPYLADRAGNVADISTATLGTRGFPTELVVTSPNADIVAPALTALSFSPTAVHVGAEAARVDVMLTIKDAGTGVFFLAGGLRSPSGQEEYCSAGATPTSGTAYDGTWTCSITIPKGAESGTWRLTVFSIDDAAGNRRSYWPADWPATGFPTTVTVSP